MTAGIAAEIRRDDERASLRSRAPTANTVAPTDRRRPRQPSRASVLPSPPRLPHTDRRARRARGRRSDPRRASLSLASVAMRRAGWRLVARLTGSSSFARRIRAPAPAPLASLASRVASRDLASGRAHPHRDDPLLRRLQRDERERQRALALRGIPSSGASPPPDGRPDADALPPQLVNRVLAVEARTPEDVLRVVDRHGASFDPVNVATALRALHRACVRACVDGTGMDGTRRVRYAKNRRVDPVAFGAKVNADPRTTALARLALHHVDAYQPRDLAGVLHALAALHDDTRVLVADTAGAGAAASLYPRLASAMATSADGFDARHCASTLGALAKLRKAHRRAFDAFGDDAWTALFRATERETVRVDARGAAETCRALGGVGAKVRATFEEKTSFAEALARAVERTAAEMDARSVTATMRAMTKVPSLREATRRGTASSSGSKRARPSSGSAASSPDGAHYSPDGASAWSSLTVAWEREAPRASVREVSDALAALAKLPEARDAMSPGAWVATARAAERAASSSRAPHARDAVVLFATSHPAAVAAAATRRATLWPALVAAVDANVRDFDADGIARALDAFGRSADARAAATKNPDAALRLAKAIERVARPNVGDARNVATTLFTILGWNGDGDGDGDGDESGDESGDGDGSGDGAFAAREGKGHLAYAYGPGDVGNVVFALARVGGGRSELVSETALRVSGWGAKISDALRETAARAHLRPAGLARAFQGLGAHEGLRRHVADETWDALAGAFARVAARPETSAAEIAKIVVAVAKLPEVADRATERAWRDAADALATKIPHMRSDHAAAVVVAVAALPGMVAHVSPELGDAMRDAARAASATSDEGTKRKAAATRTEVARAAKTLGLGLGEGEEV